MHSSFYVGSELSSLQNSFRAKESEEAQSYDMNNPSAAGMMQAPQPININYMPQMYGMPNPFIARYQSAVVPSSVPLTAIQEGKKSKGKRQTRPGTSMHDIKDKKKRRLEQNRLSARESRKKKKAYIETLEGELADLKHELDEYKIRLSENAAATKIRAETYSDASFRMRDDMQQMIDKIVLACRLEDAPAAEAAFQSLLIRYGVQSEERRKAVETLAKGIIGYAVPASYMYLLWAAKNDSGLFNPENFGPEEVKKEPQTDELEKVSEILKLNEYEQTILFKAKDGLKSELENIQGKVRKFIDAKNELYEQAKKLDTYINENIVSKLSGSIAGAYFQWLERLSERAEFKEFSLFKLNKEDFGGFDLSNPICSTVPVYGKGNNNYLPSMFLYYSYIKDIIRK